jgi:hypothetical protein
MIHCQVEIFFMVPYHLINSMHFGLILPVRIIEHQFMVSICAEVRRILAVNLAYYSLGNNDIIIIMIVFMI